MLIFDVVVFASDVVVSILDARVRRLGRRAFIRRAFVARLFSALSVLAFFGDFRERVERHRGR